MLNILGGLAIFLYGIGKIQDGLESMAGERLRHIISSITGNRFIGFGGGIISAIMVQNSNTITVMLVSFARTGLITLSQAMGVILGANIGATITVQIISF